MSELHGVGCGWTRRTFRWRESLSCRRRFRQQDLLPPVHGQQGINGLHFFVDSYYSISSNELWSHPEGHFTTRRRPRHAVCHSNVVQGDS